ncbi:hypothetical protein QR680_015698 [Steinernema hermaphroditum]|uniref:G-protein coupled receptors family 1 profile domain-containing protein n=1 Tax=Steinernema hermaphroditum TaxID=289476 RepID=A0AA39LL20_9BILA|nr:hypothetical protein QR680_015698 [Steinernema hermaphroditum]
MFSASVFTHDDYILINKISGLVMCPIFAFSAIGNSIVIVATITSKKLRSTCCLFIAIQATCELIYAASPFAFLYFTFTNKTHTHRQCYWIQFIPLGAANMAIIMMPLIAVDRFLSSKAPLWYHKKNSKLYTWILLCCPVFFEVVIKTIGFLCIDEEEVVCIVPTGLTGIAGQLWGFSQIPVAVIVLILYVSIKLRTQEEPYPAHINSSLQIIMAAYLCGYATAAVVNFTGAALNDMYKRDVRFIMTMTGFSPYAMNTGMTVSGIFAAINTASPFVILYFKSSLYRTEINALFGLKPKPLVSSIEHNKSNGN